MSPFATRLKVGSTALILEALVLDPKRTYPLLADPLGALTSISRDPKFRWEVALEGGHTATALAVQQSYLSAVRDTCDLSVPAKAALVADWEHIRPTDLAAHIPGAAPLAANHHNTAGPPAHWNCIHHSRSKACPRCRE